MPYNPKIHHRRSVRLRGYDYAKEGMYFVTICAKNRAHVFGEVDERVMILSPYGDIAQNEWLRLPNRWPHIELGELQVMPNHIHGVLVIHHPASTVVGQNARGAITLEMPEYGVSGIGGTDSPPEIPFSKIQWATRPTLGQIVGAYTSTVVTECLKWQAQNQPHIWLEKIWQRGFHEHIIRTTKAFDNISNYIINNPAKWKEDKFFTKK